MQNHYTETNAKKAVQVSNVNAFSSGAKPRILKNRWNMLKDLRMGHLRDIYDVVLRYRKENSTYSYNMFI